MRILVAEDDDTLRQGLCQALEAAGHDAIATTDGSHADTLLATEHFDLLVLDLGLPQLDGLEVLSRLRARPGPFNQEIPVLILSARGTMEQRIRGLDGGADDYLTKPFDLGEFSARVRALLRRGRPDVLELGKLLWEWNTRQGSTGDRPLTFSMAETALLEYLLRRVGRIVPKANLATLLGAASDNTIEVYVHRLRKKLVGAEVEIQTIRGLGYLIRALEQVDA
jgi:DNA-binding response OmpR family regulator